MPSSPTSWFAFLLKPVLPEKTAQLSGLAQTGGYILAAFGPALFGYSFELFQSWVPAVPTLLTIDIIMTISLFMVDRAEKSSKLLVLLGVFLYIKFFTHIS